MKILIAGAGSVGRSIARELISHGHDVTLVDRSPDAMRIASVPEADWQLADACDVGSLADAGAGDCDVVVSATGDDKANLVISLLAKTEYGVPRTVARVNNPKNEWLFDDTWGVDVAVSTPRIMTALVEEAVSVGSLVPVFTFHQSGALMHELTLPDDSPVIGEPVSAVKLPPHTVLAAILRDYRPIRPGRGDRFERGDELLFLTARAGETALEEMPAIFTGVADPAVEADGPSAEPTGPKPT
ncbi:TrkA family potassium uptake protein [Actinomyces sp.]|uniref:potassium channel family protein n=1 Tax=Actinomyces sp. TaxID=29317 RepID=UPI0026DC6EDF|nr:NAD-binding protein [Actinomyces sp.]MDO4899950.1 NAD-binding protein [Actinomyces sp.]